MTIDELKAALLGKEYPDRVELGPHAVVIDAERFLLTQFIECEQWKKDIDKCPAYERLVKFYEVVKE